MHKIKYEQFKQGKAMSGAGNYSQDMYIR